MQPIFVDKIQKNFGKTCAVDEISFAVNNEEIFGLLGPNGAGKTTAIRIILDIFKADKGSVSILGGPMTEEKKDHVGYLPEERGLYQDMPLDRCLIYMAGLKSLSVSESKTRLTKYLDRFELAAYRSKKVKELSKGMQQKAQLIATLIHEPEVVIIDEPFSALDPVNTQMVKDLLDEERKKGRAIIMCTHQMHQVEELCDRLVLIDHGRAMLYGTLEEVRNRYATQDILVNTSARLPLKITGVERVVDMNAHKKLVLKPGITAQSVLADLVRMKVAIEHFEIALPSLEEIFIQVVTEGVAKS
ncbi:MAG: ATP-binding cassette domain-containing protein [Anaerolineaceae bacterium]|nr:ATP-binding cassette domain-containing protein [Anaerolineaceae bacterium]MBN2678405.1 ATP-binding cassette domain-containing protein [Anaerolineaceae bacterium]